MTENKTKLYSISQVTKILDLKNQKTKKPVTHRLRFWESKFKQLKPTILSNGRRYYSYKDIEVTKMIIYLLKDQGLTINGAIKIMNQKPKELDDAKAISIKGDYYIKKIKFKSEQILKKIKKING